MDVAALRSVVRAESGSIVPLVGAGLALDAGAPTPDALYRRVTAALDIEASDGNLITLGKIVREAGREDEMRTTIASIIAGLRTTPTPALCALAGCPSRIILTTNYDDAIETAVRARGLEPVSVLIDDPKMGATPEPGHVHVVHLHGSPSRPDLIVLPGRDMDFLSVDEVKSTYLRALLARVDLLYLGFGFGATEVHLRALVGWVAVKAPKRRQWLLAGRTAAGAHKAQYESLAQTDLVTLATYDDRRSHDAVEEVAAELSPRTYDTASDIRDRLPYVQPVLLSVRDPDDVEMIRSQAMTFDHTERPDNVVPLEQLIEGAWVVVGAPGNGKSEMVERITQWQAPRAAVGSLQHFRAAAGDVDEGEIVRLLRDAADGRALPIERLDQPNQLVVLDGLDEVADGLRGAATDALLAARRRWPQVNWIVTSRPDAEVARLVAGGLRCVHIAQSRLWGDAYVQARGIPTRRLHAVTERQPGLADLLGVPIFARRLADQMLDDTTPSAPLDLLIGSQEVAITEEARRQRVPVADLEAWVQRLALGLSLKGRVGVPLDELAAMPVGADADGTRTQAGLVRASVLGDLPGEAAFPSRAMQEATVARRILRSRDIVVALEAAAAAVVRGAPVYRGDWEFVLDLVFEHAPPRTRERLRERDPQRWAKTVVTRGTRADGEIALDLLIEWHATRGWPFGWFFDSGFRTPRAGAVAITRRWPEIVRSRRASLIRDLADDDKGVRYRAVALLGALPLDGATRSWLLPLLSSSDGTLARTAMSVAARLGLDEALPAVLARLADADEYVRHTALEVAATMLPRDRFDELPAHLSGNDHDPLRRIAKQLKDCDLDTALRLANRVPAQPTAVWLLESLARTRADFAWTEQRIRQLVRALGSNSGAELTDPAALARVLRQHLAVAIAEIDRDHASVMVRSSWPHNQLSPLTVLDTDELKQAGATPELLRAVEDERSSLVEIAARNAAFRAPEHVSDALPQAVLNGTLQPARPWGPVARLEDPQRQHLLDAIETRWAEIGVPSTATDEVGDLADLSAEMEWRPANELWAALVRLHVVTRHDFDPLGEWQIGRWLGRTCPDAQTTIGDLAAAADVGILQKVSRIVSWAHAHGTLAGVVVDRALELESSAPGWAELAGHLVEQGAGGRTLALRAHAVAGGQPAQRAVERIDAVMARQGSADAQVEVLSRLRDRLLAGVKHEVGFPDPYADDPRVVAALYEVARAAHAVDDSRTRAFMIGRLGDLATPEAVDAIAALVDDLNIRVLESELTQAEQGLAAKLVIARLPADVVAAAARFEQRCPTRRARRTHGDQLR